MAVVCSRGCVDGGRVFAGFRRAASTAANAHARTAAPRTGDGRGDNHTVVDACPVVTGQELARRVKNPGARRLARASRCVVGDVDGARPCTLCAARQHTNTPHLCHALCCRRACEQQQKGPQHRAATRACVVVRRRRRRSRRSGTPPRAACCAGDDPDTHSAARGGSSRVLAGAGCVAEAVAA